MNRTIPAERYFALLLRRFCGAQLKVFRCTQCKNWALDPIGYRNKGAWLCQDCADGSPERE